MSVLLCALFASAVHPSQPQTELPSPELYPVPSFTETREGGTEGGTEGEREGGTEGGYPASN